MIIYTTRWKRYLELWFDETEPPGDYDVVVRHRCPNADHPGRFEAFYTLCIDLTDSADAILHRFSRNTRAQIRKSAESDALIFEFIDQPTPHQLAEFSAFYDEFARAKGVEIPGPSLLEAHRASGQFRLSRVRLGDDDLVWHANVCAGRTIGMLYSASQLRHSDIETRRLIGRANRRLHWEELQRFRGEGLRCYEFGGWYEGSSDAEKLSINRFKEEFGGTKVRWYAGVENRSMTAKLIAALPR